MDSHRHLNPAGRPLAAVTVLVTMILTTMILAIAAMVFVSSPSEAADGEQLSIRLWGTTGTERVEIEVAGNVIATHVAGTEASTWTVDADVTGPVKVRFTNDGTANGVNRNLYVDWVEYNSQRIQSESSSVFSTGTWSRDTLCGDGYKQSQGLHCNGSFTYNFASVSSVRIWAEDFDRFNDSDAINQGNVNSRPDTGVDIETAQNEPAGSTNVGWTSNGEWLEFDRELAGGDYGLRARVASDDPGSGALRILIDGELAGELSVGTTNGWHNWITQTAFTDRSIAAGQHTIRVEWTGRGNVNLSWLELSTADQAGDVVEVRLWGSTGTELVELEIDGDVVATRVADKEPSTWRVNADVTGPVKVRFTNDGIVDGRSRDLFIPWVRVNDEQIETESPDVFSTGTWDRASGCAPGYKRNQALHCNGAFTYNFGGDDPPPPPPTPTTQPPTPTPTPTPTNSNYDDHLDHLRSSSVRNTNHDDSPHRSTASAELNISDHLGRSADYLTREYGTAPEGAFPTAGGGQFRVACEFSHFAYDDPLIFPGQPEASHLHMFFGNTDTNAYTTYDTLLNTGGSTCNGQELNRTGYWAPAVFDGSGNVRIPERVIVYYKGEGIKSGFEAAVYPPEAAMIATENINAISYTEGGASGKFSFQCADNFRGGRSPAANTMVTCDGNKYRDLYNVDDDPHVTLEMNVKFPLCWNGQDASDWNNYTLPQRGGWYYGDCQNQTLLPHLEYIIVYKVNLGEDTADWFLSSDVDHRSGERKPAPAGASVHADWWGAWNTEVNQIWIDNCVNFILPEATGCGFGYLENAGPDGTNPRDVPALKRRPNYEGPDSIPAATLFGELCTADRDFERTVDAAFCRPLHMNMN